MVREAFRNNAEAVLAQPLPNGEPWMVVTNTDKLADLQNGKYYQRLTITHQSIPGASEIVIVEGVDAENPLMLRVGRGRESTEQQDWPAGAKLQGRVTGGMLDHFLQIDDDGNVQSTTRYGVKALVVNGKVRDNDNAIQLSGIQALRAVNAEPTSSSEGTYAQDLNMSVESVGGSMFVDLGGAPPTWTTNGQYADGQIVAPATPVGYNYRLELEDEHLSERAVGGDEPFNNTGQPIPAMYIPSWAPENAYRVGQWTPIPDPLEFTLTLPANGHILSEVGFICFDYQATTAPTVTITDSAGRLIADHVALNAIAGNDHFQRFPVNFSGAPSTSLTFKLEMAATGNLVGRFYWRGVAFSRT